MCQCIAHDVRMIDRKHARPAARKRTGAMSDRVGRRLYGRCAVVVGTDMHRELRISA